jgi:hypothetical protein
MVFDNFILGSSLTSNNNDISDSFIDSCNALYIIPKYKSDNSNIIIYNINNSNLSDDSNIEILYNIPLYTSSNIKEYFLIKDTDKFKLCSTDLSNFFIINTDYTYYTCNITDTYNCNNDYIDGFYHNKNYYLISKSGEYITIINDDYTIDVVEAIYSKASITFDISDNSDNDVICVKVENYIYIILSNENLILKWDIINMTTKGLVINEYQILQRQFSKAIYSKISNKIYLIPYNINVLYTIDFATDDIKAVNLEGLTNSQAFFTTAIETHGYIYMIPESYVSIYVFNIYKNKLDITINISAYNNELYTSNKFINAHLFEDALRKRIFVILNKSNKLGLIDYDQAADTILDSKPNFDLISHNLFTKTGTSEYNLTEPFELSIGTYYNTNNTRGTVLYDLSTPATSNISLWRPKPVISLSDNTFFSNNIENNKYFQDKDSKKIFEIDVNSSYYFNSKDTIDNLAINNIYSINNNTIYFIPYNCPFLLALELDEIVPVLKIISIDNTRDDNTNNFQDFMENVNGKFNSSIIVESKLYLVPYIDAITINIIPFVIYDFSNNNVKVIDLKPYIKTVDETATYEKLFCKVLFYNDEDNKYLFIIKENTISSSFVYNINEQEINTIIDNDNAEYSDGYIKEKKIYLLSNTSNKLYTKIIEINDDDDKVTFKTDNIKDFTESASATNPVYSKILYYNDILYLIPFNGSEIGIFNTTNNSLNTKEITNSGYTINEQLFKGGTLIKLNNKMYIIMVPFEATKLYLYNITDDEFTYIEDSIFKNNKFIDCTVDLKGNIYMNTSTGTILYYLLSIEKFYLEPRLPVLTKATISFKDIYQKFHNDYVYPNYNYNNKQIKFSDYFNQGGSLYYTTNTNKNNIFVSGDNIDISSANTNSTTNSTYNDFIKLQSNVPLYLYKYNKIRSQRYEYYDNYIGNNTHIIDSIHLSPDNKYFYDVKTSSDTTTLTFKNIQHKYTSNITFAHISGGILTDFNINLNEISIKDSLDTTNSILDFTTVTILNNNNTSLKTKILDINSSNFIKHGITGTTPIETMKQLSTINVNVKGIIKKGIDIMIDGLDNTTYDNDDTYLSKLETININISENGLILYGGDNINRKTLIILNNPRNLLKDLTVNIYEDISYELIPYYTDNTNITNTKITKVIYNITSDININIDDYKDFIYLTDIIIITNNNITFTSTIELRHKLNIIIYNN